MVLIFIVATVLKTLSVYGAASILGLPEEQKRIASVSLNARGAMEILRAGMGYRVGIINETWLTSLVLMALLTSVISLPLIKLARKKEKVHECAMDYSH